MFYPGENVQQVEYQAAHHELVASAKAVKLAHEVMPGHGGLYAGGRAIYARTCAPDDVQAAGEADRDNYFFIDVQSRERIPCLGQKADGAGIHALRTEPEDEHPAGKGTVDFCVLQLLFQPLHHGEQGADGEKADGNAMRRGR